LFLRKRFAVFALLVAGAVVSLWWGLAPLRAADPVPIACPNGQTVFLKGPAPPSQALLVTLGERAVGGGVADRNGFYRIPLRANERPGVYPVEVRLRGSRAVVARFTCFVDVPLDSVPETPTLPAATQVTRVPLPTSTAAPVITPVPVAPTPTAMRLTTPVPEQTVAPSPTPTLAGSPVATSTAGPTTTPGPTTTVTVTPIPNANSVRIIQVVLRVPGLSNDEYVEIRNTTTRSINMTAWRLVNVNRNDVAPYVFPEFVIAPAQTINLYSAVDEDDPEVGEFYWKRTDVWRAGDRAELRDATDRLISFLIVQG
jgi:hypothetical protein